MSEAQDHALESFLTLVAERGFASVSLHDVARAAGLGMGELYGLYPDKVSLVSALMAQVDARVLAGTPHEHDPEETARDRLFDVMMRRYDTLKPHRAALKAVRRAAVRDPFLALALAPAFRRSMAAMLEAAGITSEGLGGALRQKGLLAIHNAVTRVFEQDDTADLSKTMVALDGRLKTASRWAQLIDRYGISPRAR